MTQHTSYLTEWTDAERDRLRLIRLQRDWTFKQMATHVGVTAAVLRKALGADERGQLNERSIFKVRRWLSSQIERPAVSA